MGCVSGVVEELHFCDSEHLKSISHFRLIKGTSLESRFRIL